MICLYFLYIAVACIATRCLTDILFASTTCGVVSGLTWSQLDAVTDVAVPPQQVHSNGACLDDEILADPEIQDAIKNEGKVHREFEIVNTDRATLGRLGGAIAKQHGDSGFAGEISIDFKVNFSYTGQSSGIHCLNVIHSICLLQPKCVPRKAHMNLYQFAPIHRLVLHHFCLGQNSFRDRFACHKWVWMLVLTVSCL